MFVPIYYKNIVNALTPHSNQTSKLDRTLAESLGMPDGGTNIVFPITSIGIYVLLKFMQASALVLRTSLVFCINTVHANRV